jgi:hypothetical protein
MIMKTQDDIKLETFVAWLEKNCDGINKAPKQYVSYQFLKGKRLISGCCITKPTAKGHTNFFHVNRECEAFMKAAREFFGPEHGDASECFEGKQARWNLNGSAGLIPRG